MRPENAAWSVSLLCVLLAAACGGRTVIGDTSSGSAESGSASEAGEAGEASEAGEVGEVGEASGTVTTGDGEDSTTGTPFDLPSSECIDPRENAFNFSVSGFSDFEPVHLEARCTVNSLTSGFAGGWFISMNQCANAAGGPEFHELSMQGMPDTMPFVSVGQSVRINYVQRSAFGPAERWLTLRGEGDTLLYAAFKANQLPIQDPSSNDYIDFSPLELASVEIGCPGVDIDGCGPVARRGLQVGWRGFEDVVRDHDFGYVGDFVSIQIVVETFTEVLENWCDDYPDRIYEAEFFLIPEG